MTTPSKPAVCIAVTRGNRRINGPFDPYIGYCLRCTWTVAGDVDRVDAAVARHGLDTTSLPPVRSTP